MRIKHQFGVGSESALPTHGAKRAELSTRAARDYLTDDDLFTIVVVVRRRLSPSSVVVRRSSRRRRRRRHRSVGRRQCMRGLEFFRLRLDKKKTKIRWHYLAVKLLTTEAAETTTTVYGLRPPCY